MKAIIGIDPQRDFCPGGKLAVPDGNTVIEPLNKLLEIFPCRALTQDWHPANHLSFASSHEGKEPFETIELDYGEQILWPEHCIQDSMGAMMHIGLRTALADVVVRKGFRRLIDSYSAFFENDRKTPTGLAGYLRERGVTAVYLAGLAYDFCVGWSALDAVKLGFEAVVIEDACRAIDFKGSARQMTRDLEGAGCRFRSMSQVLREF